jgi:putative ABC transport system permease protein
MNVFLSIKQFFNDLRRQKLRSFMTMFGIFWGTCSIVLLLAFGTGITAKEYKGLPKGRRIRPTDDDVNYIKQRAKTIARIAPENGRGMNLKFGRQLTRRTVMGVWPEYGIMRNLIPEIGSRFINQLDLDNRRRVIFLGNIIACSAIVSPLPWVGKSWSTGCRTRSLAS